MTLTSFHIPIHFHRAIGECEILILPRQAGRRSASSFTNDCTSYAGRFEESSMPKNDGKTVQQRFNERYIIDPITGCWNWTAAKNSHGYAYIFPGPPSRKACVKAANLAYTWKFGPIPKGLHIDHKCRNRGCVNPDHVEAVTRATNTYNSDTNPAAINARKTQCKRGHPFTPENTGSTTNGGRYCLTCSRTKAWEKKG